MKPEDLKNIEPLHLHDIKMGQGSIWKKDKEIVIVVSSIQNLLPCGCPGSQNIRVSDIDGKLCYDILEKFNPKGYRYIHGTMLQTKEWDSYWSEFYIKYPYLKPHSIFRS